MPSRTGNTLTLTCLWNWLGKDPWECSLKSVVNILTIVYSTTICVLVAVLDSELNELNEVTTANKLGGGTPTISRDPYTIVVTNLPLNVSVESLELYFESERCSGGGNVDNVKLFPAASGAIVTFAKEKGGH